MRIWVDADACPAAIKEVLYRAAERTRVELILVANQFLRVRSSPYIRAIQVERGFDIADNHISAQAATGDLVVTADIPLAAEVVAKGVHALNPRGEIYDAENIRELLNLRDFMDTMRAGGVQTSGPPPLSKSDVQSFANALDRLLTRRLKT